jgi:hypothetical protein
MELMSAPLQEEAGSYEETSLTEYMRDMSVSVGRIEDSSVADLTVDERRQVILTELAKIMDLIELITAEFNESASDALALNHRQVFDYLRDLEADVDQASQQVAENGPNYYLAGKIAGSCNACHQRLWNQESTD